MEHTSRQRAIAIFIDEFDRFRHPDGRVLFADTIKALSDRVVSSTIVLIGVADSVGELIREHRSVERALVQIQMPRMSASELAEIATNGIAAASMTIAGGAVARITALSQGLPHYTHLLTQFAAQSALADRRVHVGVRDVDAAVTRAIERAQQTIVEAYREAVIGRPGAIYPQVLLACALADEDEFGYFASSDVREPLSKILDKPSKPSTFARHLEELSSESHGSILQRSGSAGRRATASSTRSSNRTSRCAASRRASCVPATSSSPTSEFETATGRARARYPGPALLRTLPSRTRPPEP